MSKISFWFVLSIAVFVSAFCHAADFPIVSVMISTDHQTVKVKAHGEAENLGNNTAKYAITASVDPASLENNEVRPVDPVWSCVRVIPVPLPPNDPTVTITTGTDNTNSWSAKTSSPYVEQWRLTFKVSVIYDQLDKVTGKKKTDGSGNVLKFGPYSKTVNCTFKTTTGKFKIKMISKDDFPGHATYDFGLGETGTIEAWSFDNSQQYTIDSSDTQPIDVMKMTSETGFQVYAKAGTALVTIKAKNGTIDLGEEKVTATVVKPTSIYLIDDPNCRRGGYYHEINTYGFSLVGRYVIEPFNVSFMNLRTMEWGDKKSYGMPGYAEYEGDSNEATNYFAKLRIVGSLHPPSNPPSKHFSCKTTYETSKNRIDGPFLNISKDIDRTGIPTSHGLPKSEPKTGAVKIDLPIRYYVTENNNTLPNSGAEVNGVTSIMNIKKHGEKYIITIRKTELTSVSESSDAPTKTWTPYIPYVLPNN
ncbi:MAG: hypothetical protein LBC74_08165 [Planctomycetaceae bacterium]|nr:hypothetical protein [Planctomycetaceae bacterium]